MSVDHSFRKLLFDVDAPRLGVYRGLNPYEYAKAILNVPVAATLIDGWNALYAQPFEGITADGARERGLFNLADEGAPAGAMVHAATALLDVLSSTERQKLCYPLEAAQWRSWSNPEMSSSRTKFPVYLFALRLKIA